MFQVQDTRKLLDLQQILFRWWRQVGRVLPWREKITDQPNFSSDISVRGASTVREAAFHQYMLGHLHRDPYRVVVAEVMLQQTQVDRVETKYREWMRRWPTVRDLATAELSEVLIFWQGLGYNRRARFLWLLAKEVVLVRDGVWPVTEVELLQLPGVGRYTARAVLSFAFGQHVAVVDTNVKRVLRRMFEGLEALAQPVKTEREWFDWADTFLPMDQADPWNQLIMDFGSIVCSAKQPKCEGCPVAQVCLAQQSAVRAGFNTYSALLTEDRDKLVRLAQGKKTKKLKVRFEDSDRFFRGRIVDHLRQHSIEVEKLRQALSVEHGLLEHERFNRLVSRLCAEGLISRSGSVLSLG